jgi:hypothetical protein
VQEGPDDIVCLHRTAPGGADKSYRIHVARLAGVPREVVDRAEQMLAELEAGPKGGHGAAGPSGHAAERPGPQGVLIDAPRQTYCTQARWRGGVLLGNLAVWAGKKMERDARRLKATNAPGVEPLVTPTCRKG